MATSVISGIPSTGFGVEQGVDIQLDLPTWIAFAPQPEMVLEACLEGSSLPMVFYEEWVAVLVDEVDVDPGGGFIIRGRLLGTEDPSRLEEVGNLVESDGIHFCGDQPCPHPNPNALHVTRVRGWTMVDFSADYMTAKGKALLKNEVNKLLGGPGRRPRGKEPKAKEKAEKGKPGAKNAPRKAVKAETKKAAKAAPKVRGRKPTPPPHGIIEIPSEEELEEEEEPPAGGGGVTSEMKATLKETLRRTKERMVSGGLGRFSQGMRNLGAGRDPGASGCAVAVSPMTTGSHLAPGVATPLPLKGLEGTNGGALTNLKKKRKADKDPGTALVAQAVKVAEAGKQEKKRRKKRDQAERLVELLRGKKDKKEKKKKKKKQRMKPDPDGSDGDGEGDYGGGSSDSSYYGEGSESGSDSDLSFEAPLRRKAVKEPGSVMKLLIKHAQEQMDRGQVIDQVASRGDLTSGIKISTYFALLIRPYYSNNSPLLRELYALSQTIDQLRSGQLLQTADSLASRFIAVHTAMSEGGWSTASQLEMFPLEPIQSAGTAAMLAAQKHKKLVAKSQGNYYQPQQWWSSGGKGKGSQKGEKGKKGEAKGKGKQKTKGGRDHQWWQRSENPWKENKEEAAKKTPPAS